MPKEKVIQREGFAFTFNPGACERCRGRCCNGESGSIFVNSSEIRAISKFLGIEISEFMEEYLVKISQKFSIREIRPNNNYACIFYDREKNRCSIYPVRPHQCKAFPFWGYFRDRPQEAAREYPGVSLLGSE
jgi:Fe-S-cluster containining protein